MAREQYNQQFLDIIERLNPAQRDAVDCIEGPVLVVAGPGTGKTQLLSARVGNILLKTDTAPANILCLTFTDAGVLAMRKRLVEFIGPEAHRVHIYTFHSFCNSIIQNNLELFGRRGLEPLSELERVELIRQIIDALPVNHPLRLGKNDPYFYENHLSRLFQSIKAENWTVNDVLKKTDEYLADLPNRKEYVYQVNRGEIRKGAPKMAKLETERERMLRFKAAVRLFPNYLEAMRRARRYDYEDMLLWVLQAFEKQESLLRSYQEQYLYLLVDEYQDTNGAQNAILLKLIDYWDKPNIFIVGDDDQSIYEFQGARLKNLSDFYYRYQPDLKLVLLEQNYRSSQQILDAAALLIRYNERRIIHELGELSIKKELQARHPKWGKLKRPPRIVEYQNPLEELSDVLLQIEQLQEAGVPLSEIAVIYAKHRQAYQLIELLGKKGLPYEAKRKINILDLPLIADLRTILIYLQMESEQPYSAEHLLFQILHFPFLTINPRDLAAVSLRQARANYTDRQNWRDLLGRSAYLAELKLENPDALIRFGQLLMEWLGDLHSLPLLKLAERIINRSGLLSYILGHREQSIQLSALSAFFDFLRTETFRRPRLSLNEWLDMLKKMDDNRLAIELQLTNPGIDAIQLVTAHSAKGLEFEYVFLIDCLEEHWEPNRRSGRYRFPMPDTLTLSGEEDAMEARRRLFYVAMTRAKHFLQLSYSLVDAKGKVQQRAAFLDELLDSDQLEIASKKVDRVLLDDIQILQLQEGEIELRERPPAAVLDELLAGLTLSITALNQYLRCPLAFYYERVLRAPVAWSEAASYGAAIHNTLQRLFEQMLQSPTKNFPSVSFFLDVFSAEFKKFQGYFSKQNYQQRLAEGRRKLEEIYESKHRRWHKNVKLEFNIKNVEVGGAPITGTIDKLEYHNQQQVIIVDYKTGSRDAKKLKRPDEKQLYGGNYWRQLLFYKLLYEAYDQSGRRVKNGVLSYLEPDRQGRYLETLFEYRAEEVDFVRNLVVDVYAKIRRHEFFTGCGEPNCQWCQFARRSQAPNSFADPELESLDD